MRFRASWAVVVAAALLVGLLAYGVARKGRPSIDQASATVRGRCAGAGAAACSARGGERSLADYRGKVVVLNFWASWCPPCTEELPLLERTHKRSPAGRARCWASTPGHHRPRAAVRARFKLTYPSLRDRDGQFADRYGSRAYPETFVIDRRGRIAAQRRGPVDQAWLDKTWRRCSGAGVTPRSLAARARCCWPRGRRRAAGLAARRRGRGHVRGVRHARSTSRSRRRRPGARVHPRARSREGKDKQQIKDALVAEYGPGVLADPPSSGFDLAV